MVSRGLSPPPPRTLRTNSARSVEQFRGLSSTRCCHRSISLSVSQHAARSSTTSLLPAGFLHVKQSRRRYKQVVNKDLDKDEPILAYAQSLKRQGVLGELAGLLPACAQSQGALGLLFTSLPTLLSNRPVDKCMVLLRTTQIAPDIFNQVFSNNGLFPFHAQIKRAYRGRS